jgi:FKBP-type peptidyl-prolyl cis-trans isomerase
MKFTKTLLVAPLIAGALITSSFAAADSNDDVSYSVGYEMGSNLKAQLAQGNVETDNAELISGLKDGIADKKAKLDDKQMQSAMMEFQKQAMAAQQKAQANKG